MEGQGQSRSPRVAEWSMGRRHAAGDFSFEPRASRDVGNAVVAPFGDVDRRGELSCG